MTKSQIAQSSDLLKPLWPLIGWALNGLLLIVLSILGYQLKNANETLLRLNEAVIMLKVQVEHLDKQQVSDVVKIERLQEQYFQIISRP